MSRSRSTLAGLVTATAAAGLALAGCHSSSGSASGSASSAAAPGTAAAGTAAPGTAAPGTAAAVATASSAVVSGAGSVAYFPDQVGDTWVYSLDSDGTKGTVTNKVTAVTPVASGTKVTITDTDSAFGSSKPIILQYTVHPDGSISIPVDLGATSGLKLKSGSFGWPGPAALASGQPEDETIVMSGSVSGQSMTVTAKAVIKGDGTQGVSVPAGHFSATVVDDVETVKILNSPSTTDEKTWLVSGVGPVKSEVTSKVGGTSFISETEELISFTRG